jgi:hypothetical protein
MHSQDYREGDSAVKKTLSDLALPLHVADKHTYDSRFISEGVAEVSQIFFRDTHVLPKLVSNGEHCRRDRW